ncbi:unnamed protein product [Rhizophagus irregularis]|nr:unnamed protein product [Rhizophagus irregularis]
MAPKQTLASATTPGTKLDKNLHYCSFSNKCYSQTHLQLVLQRTLDVFIESIEILFHVLIMLIPMPGCEVIFLLWNILHKLGIHIQQALIAQEMAGQGDQEGTDLLLQQFSPIENVSDKSLEEMNQYLEMIDCKNNYLLEN